MQWIDSLEAKFGRFAIPHVIRFIALFQLLNWFLIRASPGFAELLSFDRQGILSGEVWRLFSYALLPGSLGIIWLLFGVMFLWLLSDGLEQAWGAFRVNLYLLAGLVFGAIGGFLGTMPDHGWLLWMSVLFAFAFYYPDYEIMLYLILPMKIKWVAWITAATAGFALIGNPSMRISIIFGLMNFLIVFAPGYIRDLRNRAKVSERRGRFEAAQAPEGEALHVCSVCGKTDLTHPQLSFRVTASGDDICEECRGKS
jgi:hypothetical protein